MKGRWVLIALRASAAAAALAFGLWAAAAGFALVYQGGTGWLIAMLQFVQLGLGTAGAVFAGRLALSGARAQGAGVLVWALLGAVAGGTLGILTSLSGSMRMTHDFDVRPWLDPEATGALGFLVGGGLDLILALVWHRRRKHIEETP